MPLRTPFTLARLLLTAGLFLAAPHIRAEEQEDAVATRQARAAMNPYAKNYVSLEMARNYPVSFSQNHFEPGRYSPVFGFRHDMDEHWIMGISAQFKIFHRKPEDEEPVPPPESVIPGTEVIKPKQSDVLSFWTLSHEALYSIRLNHPTYLLVGPKMLYLLPANSAKIPLQRAADFQTEIGVAFSMGLTHVVSDRYLLTARFDRWRGTRTMRFHGLEFAMGVSVALP